MKSRIARASWRGFLVPFALLFAYSWWAFMTPGPWTAVFEASGERLPEMAPGFPPTMPAAAFDKLGDKKGAYVLFQAVDIPYAILNFVALGAAIALGLKKTGLGSGVLRFALVAPALYLGAEFIENGLLAGFASGRLPLVEPIVLAQQATTTVKLASGWFSIIAALIGVLAALAAGLFGKKAR